MNYRPSLPHDLFHSHIIPDILSEHLHLLLVENEPPSWHAFHTLPLVSFAFRNTCQSLYMAIFGLESYNGCSAIYDIITFAQSLWTLARLPSEPTEPFEFSYQELMSNKSLIGVYISIALARSFLNVDVLWPLMGQGAATELSGLDHDELPSEAYPGSGRQLFKMRDEKMHRVYMPLTCATKLCDFIIPARLAHKVAGYLAEVIPTYSTIPVMLKYTQDLESYIVRGHRVQRETYVDWTLQTLHLIEHCGDLVIQMQTSGCLVNSFTRSSFIPDEVVQATKISTSLHSVVNADWGEDSGEIRGRASALLRQWAHIQ